MMTLQRMIIVTRYKIPLQTEIPVKGTTTNGRPPSKDDWKQYPPPFISFANIYFKRESWIIFQNFSSLNPLEIPPPPHLLISFFMLCSVKWRVKHTPEKFLQRLIYKEIFWLCGILSIILENCENYGKQNFQFSVWIVAGNDPGMILILIIV